jgi:matrixin
VDTALNLNLPWATSGEPSSYDVQTVALHEFGHCLELADNSDSGTVMYRYTNTGDIRRSLSLDDVSGIQFLYPVDGRTPAGSEACHKVGSCKVCEQVQTVTVAMGLRKPEIESLNFGELQTFMLQRPQPRALLFEIVADLPELEDITLNHEEEITEAWASITDDWLPGLYWLSGNINRGRNLVLTEARAAALVKGIEVLRGHSSWQLKRDLNKTDKYIRSHIGWSLEGMRSELFEEYDQRRTPTASGTERGVSRE